MGLQETWHSPLLVKVIWKVTSMVLFSAVCMGMVASKYFNLWKWFIRENIGVSISFSVFCPVNFGAATW